VRQAPPVGVTCSGGGAWRATGALLGALAITAVLAWALLHLAVASQAVLVAASLVLPAAGVSIWRLARPLPATLRWDGAAWRVDDTEGEADVMLDLDAWLLVRFRARDAGVRWLPVPRHEAGGAWHALRSALYAGRAAPAPVAEA
jgi:hypothetical protein